MGQISQSQVQDFFQRGAESSNTTEQGRALEDLVCYLFETIPGIEVTERDATNAFGTEEIDVAFWNDQSRQGLWFLPTILLVECKNWSKPVGTEEVAYFIRKLQNRGLNLGFLIATRGITGSEHDLTDARFAIASALKDGIRIVVVDREEIEQLTHSDDIVRLVKTKLTRLAVRVTSS